MHNVKLWATRIYRCTVKMRAGLFSVHLLMKHLFYLMGSSPITTCKFSPLKYLKMLSGPSMAQTQSWTTIFSHSGMTFCLPFMVIPRKKIPILSYSHLIIRTFTFPSSIFLKFQSARSSTLCLRSTWISQWPRLPSNKAGIWYRCSGARMLPLDIVAPRRAGPPANGSTERSVASTPRQSESEEQQIQEIISITSKSKMA